MKFQTGTMELLSLNYELAILSNGYVKSRLTFPTQYVIVLWVSGTHSFFSICIHAVKVYIVIENTLPFLNTDM